MKKHIKSLKKKLKIYNPKLNEECGEISNLERKNYSKPIVNHNIQQRLFKSLYAEI